MGMHYAVCLYLNVPDDTLINRNHHDRARSSKPLWCCGGVGIRGPALVETETDDFPKMSRFECHVFHHRTCSSSEGGGPGDRQCALTRLYAAGDP